MSNLAKRLLKFEIDDYSLKEISDSQLMELEMMVVSEGDNKHELPITREAIVNSAQTIIGKPVLFKFNNATQDVMGHEDDEIACGVCCLTSDDYYFKEIDGKLWLIIKAYLWKVYFEEVINIFIRDKQKAISMEMFIVDSEDDEDEETLETITSFCFAGVTLLGNEYSPAIENANAIVTKYSEDKDYKKMIEYTKKILFQNKDITKSKKEVDKVDNFNKKDFLAKYSMTANEMFEIFEAGLKGMKYTDSEGYECKKYYVRDFNNQYVFCSDWEEGCVKAIPYTFEGKKCGYNFTDMKYARLTYVVDEEKEDDIMQTYANEQSEQKVSNVTKEFEAKIAELEKEKEEFSAKITELESNIEQSKNSFEESNTKLEESNAKIAEFETKITELTEFKENVIKQEQENKVNYAIETVKDSLTDEQITEWKAKVSEFETVDSYTNALQAFAYTQVKKIPEKDNINRIHIPQEGSNLKKGLWD